MHLYEIYCSMNIVLYTDVQECGYTIGENMM